jgi:integrase
MPYLMPNGKWRAKRMIHGQVKTKVFQTKQEAKKWEASQEAEAWVAESSMTRMVSLLDFNNAYLDMAIERFAHKTVSEKKLAFRYLFKIVSPTLTLEAFTASMALDVLRSIARTSSGHAANKARKNLISAWEWGKKYYGLPVVNPFREVEKFPADQKPRYVPPEEDFWKAFEKASPHDQVFLLFMLHTGARRAEVFRARWDDADFAGRKIRLGTRKTAHGGMEYAWVPMTTELHNALAEHRMKSRSVFIFTDPETGEPYKARQHFMERLCNRANVKPFGFHAVRHLSATILAHEGLDIPTVQSVLRHKNPNTTAKYIKSLGVQPEKLDRAFAKRKGPKVLPFEPVKKAIGT